MSGTCYIRSETELTYETCSFDVGFYLFHFQKKKKKNGTVVYEIYIVYALEVSLYVITKAYSFVKKKGKWVITELHECAYPHILEEKKKKKETK